MRFVRSTVALLITGIILSCLTGVPLAQADGESEIVVAAVFEPFKKTSKKFLKVAVTAPGYANQYCNIWYTFSATPRQDVHRKQLILNRNGRTRTKFGPYRNQDVSFGVWTVWIEIVDENGKVLTALSKEVANGTADEIANARRLEKEWFAARLSVMSKLYDEFIEESKDLDEEQKDTDLEEDWRTDSEWVIKIFNWRDAHRVKLDALREEWNVKYRASEFGGMKILGDVFPGSVRYYKQTLDMEYRVILTISDSLSWADVRWEEENKKLKEGGGGEGGIGGGGGGGIGGGGGGGIGGGGGGGNGGGGNGGGGNGGGGGGIGGGGLGIGGDGENDDDFPEGEGAKVFRTYESAMAHREEMVAQGNMMYDFKGKIKRFRRILDREFERHMKGIGLVDECGFGAVYQDVDRIALMARVLEKEYNAYADGPGQGEEKIVFPLDQWAGWPGDWAGQLMRASEAFNKYTAPKNLIKEARKNNVLAGDQARLDTLSEILVTLQTLRSLYLKDLYIKYSPPPESKEPLIIAPDASMEQTKEWFDQLLLELEEWIEVDRSKRRSRFTKLQEKFTDLGSIMKDNLSNPAADTLFGTQGRRGWFRSWDSRLARALNDIGPADRYLDAGRLYFPNASQHLRNAHGKLSVVREKALRYYDPKATGNVVDKEKLKTELMTAFGVFETVMGQLEKELQRKQINTILDDIRKEFLK